MALLEENITPCIASTHTCVERPITEIQESEQSLRKANQRKLTIDAVREPYSMARGVEEPTMGGTIHTMSIMQITTPGLTGAKKDAGLQNRRMSAVRILPLIDEVASRRLQAGWQIGGHHAPDGYNIPIVHAGKGSGGSIILEWELISTFLASLFSRRFRAHIQTRRLSVKI